MVSSLIKSQFYILYFKSSPSGTNSQTIQLQHHLPMASKLARHRPKRLIQLSRALCDTMVITS